MRCKRCGAAMAEGTLRCARCGAEVRIVPDYNPLDEVLAAQVKGAIDGSRAPLDEYEYRAGNPGSGRNARSGRTGYMGGASAARRQTGRTASVNDRTAAGRQASRTGYMRNTGSVRDARGASGRGPDGAMTPEQRRKQAERRRERKRRKRLRMLLMLAIVALVLAVFGVILYQFSYKGQVRRGYKYLQSKEYGEAKSCFQRAVDRKPKRGEAYKGLMEVYLAQDNREKAETMFLDAIDSYPDSAELYEACFSFYLAIKKEGEIPLLLDGARMDVTKKLTAYAAEAPGFSLSEEESFEDVQQLTLESSENAIYYTIDGSDPCYSPTRIKYKDPIQISEGENVIKAISVNKKKIPSLTVTKTYMVELPLEAAPAVSPSTGQYDGPKQITIVVPDGYKAYYTMDNREPTEDSKLYDGPIDMPEGSTIFKAVLVNGKGRLSGVTTRNYERSSGE